MCRDKKVGSIRKPGFGKFCDGIKQIGRTNFDTTANNKWSPVVRHTSWFFFAVVLVLFSGKPLLAWQTEGSKNSLPNNSVVLAKVDEQEIRMNDVRFFLARLSTMTKGQRTMQGLVLDNAKESMKPLSVAMVRQTVKQIIRRKLLYRYLEDAGKMVEPKEVNKDLADLEKSFGKKGFEKWLTTNHATKAQMAEEIRFDRSWKKYRNRMLSKERIEKLFSKYKPVFDGTQLEVAHILWNRKRLKGKDLKKSLAEFQVVGKRVSEGEISFEDAAKEFSDGASKNQGGYLGWINISGPMTPEFCKAAFRLKDGQVSEVVVSPHGFHLIKVLNRNPGKKTLDEVREKVWQFGEKKLVQLMESKIRKKSIIWSNQGVWKDRPPQ